MTIEQWRSRIIRHAEAFPDGAKCRVMEITMAGRAPIEQGG